MPIHAHTLCLFYIAAVSQAWAQTFYDVLKADPQHKLIMKAVDADPEGKMKQMLQDTAPVTAFVPIDKVIPATAQNSTGNKGSTASRPPASSGASTSRVSKTSLDTQCAA